MWSSPQTSPVCWMLIRSPARHLTDRPTRTSASTSSPSRAQRGPRHGLGGSRGRPKSCGSRMPSVARLGHRPHGAVKDHRVVRQATSALVEGVNRMTDPTIYEYAGGAAAFQRLVERFYPKIRADALLAPLFAHLT